MFTGATRVSRKRNEKAIWLVNDISREVMAFCPSCKAMETISLRGEQIVPTRRFTQKRGAVFHTCGSNVPCRLYSLS